ncbi:MAG: hypothetical protein DRP86_03855 [Candidatus Neomarinimicrobiota bacterium]|nr:MAG: hypothetical protein DRP86_03855 [Candidatus Neomarinimicrobiota bacterium]
MRLIKYILLITAIITPLTASDINRTELVVENHHLYFYYNISNIGLGYQTTPHFAELLQIELRGYPKTLAGPLAYRTDPELYNMGVYKYWNFWNIYANAQRPYHVRLFYGEIRRQKDKGYNVRGTFFSFSHLLSIGKDIVPYPSMEIGFENKHIEYFSELAQEIFTQRFSLLFIGRELDDQIVKFTFNRKGISSGKMPVFQLPNTLVRFSANWSLQTPYDRQAALLFGRAYQIHVRSYHFYLTPFLGARLYLPITINIDNTFIIDSYSLSLIPIFQVECYFPDKILVTD